MSTASTLSQLSQEVGTLLRHDNLDVRIHQWLKMAYRDMVTRASLWRFCTLSSAITVSTAGLFDLSTAPGCDILGLVFVSSAGDNACPKYLQPTDFNRIIHSREGSSVPSGTPLVWTRQGADGRMYPAPSIAGNAYVLYSPNSVDLPTQSTHRFQVPYHWENALIWGAAAIGAKSLIPQLYPLFQGEYEEAIQKMVSMLTYRPDSTSVMRSVVSPYGGTVTGRRFRLPDEVPGP